MLYSCLYAAIVAACFGLLMPRIGMRLLKEICPSFFARLNNFLTFGLSEALETYDDDLWGADGPDMEQEAFPYVLKLSLSLAFSAGQAAALWNAGVVGIVFWAAVGSAIPAIFGVITIGVGIPLTLIRFKLGCGKNSYAAMADTAYSCQLPAKVYPYTLADRIYDFVTDRLEGFKTDPVGSFSFADRLYDRVKRCLRRGAR